MNDAICETCGIRGAVPGQLPSCENPICPQTGFARAFATRAAPSPSLGEPVLNALDEYERRTKLLPAQHEIPERGCCSYNWRMAIIKEIRALLSASPAPADGWVKIDNPDYAEYLRKDWVWVPREPTQEQLIAARDWSHKKFGKPIGNEDATGCYSVMLAAATKVAE